MKRQPIRPLTPARQRLAGDPEVLAMVDRLCRQAARRWDLDVDDLRSAAHLVVVRSAGNYKRRPDDFIATAYHAVRWVIHQAVVDRAKRRCVSLARVADPAEPARRGWSSDDPDLSDLPTWQYAQLYRTIETGAPGGAERIARRFGVSLDVAARLVSEGSARLAVYRRAHPGLAQGRFLIPATMLARMG